MTHTRFLHTSDFQLGMTRWFLTPEAQSRFTHSRLAAIRRLGELAEECGAEFIVVAGDVFEHNSLSKQATGRAREVLAQLPVPVYLLSGNHDPLVADSIFFTAAQAENTVVFDSSKPVEFRSGVELVGAPYFTKYPSTDLVGEALEGLEPTEAIRIMVGHGQAQSWSSDEDPGLIDLDRVESALAKGIIDYVALGDTHSTLAVGDTGKVWFSGSPETTDFHELPGNNGEFASGNALLVDIEKTAERSNVEVTQLEVGEWTFNAISAQVNSAEEVEEFLEQLAAYPHKDRTVIKYSLEGTIDLAANQRLESGLAELEPVFANLYVRERTQNLHLQPGEEELVSLDISGYAAGALQELVDHLNEPEPEPEVRDMANLLFRLAAKGAK